MGFFMIRRLFSTLIVLCLFVSHTRAISAEENFLLIDGITNETVLKLGAHVEDRISPCSTFKIILSLMGYDAGILIDETTPTWDFQDGYDDWLASWRAPLTPKSWMQYSCVWYSKVLSLQLGLEKIQNYLTSMEYGNKDMSGGLAQPGPTDPAWINVAAGWLNIDPAFVDQFFTPWIKTGKYIPYLGFYEGKPAATSLAYLGNLGASIYCLGTLPSFRNRGLGTAVTHACLKAAKDKNIAQAVLYGSKMGQPMYKKIGFKLMQTIREYSCAQI